MFSRCRHLRPCLVGAGLSIYLLGSVLNPSVAAGQAGGATVGADPLKLATDNLKTCLQQHYDAGNPDRADRSGRRLTEACRTEWDTAQLACEAQSGKPQEYCRARTTMMLLGFVPMH